MTTGSAMRRRQVHLDFHTPGEIPGIGADFDPVRFARTVQDARIDSMTVFARCHHGFSYHPTAVGVMHPGLDFDLLGAQIDALHGIGVRAPIYITVGWDEQMAERHPEWLQLDVTGRICRSRPDDLTAWQFLDLASPYVDYVLAITAEVLERYAPVDGIFFDIILQQPGGNGSVWRRRRLRELGIDRDDADALRAFELGIERAFMARAASLVRAAHPEASIFFNSRLHPDRDPAAGSRAELSSYSHVEIESLPGGKWGYNHYPLFAAYFQTLPLPLLGMTGIFHTTWGDFGSIKTEPALRYEVARMLASGAACSVGDHLHPRGVLEPALYDRLGRVYARVAALEPWLAGATSIADVGVLLTETGPRAEPTGRDADEGAMRMLLELHRPFQFLDREADFGPYAVLIAPDELPVDAALGEKLDAYLAEGGALLLTHRSGLTPEGDQFAPALAPWLGLTYQGDVPATPDYLVAEPALGEPFIGFRQVFYEPGSAVTAAGAEVLARVGLPYLTRQPERFYGHHHAPYARTSEFVAVARQGKVAYLHSPLFTAYRRHAVPAYRDLVGSLLTRLQPHPLVEAPGLPTTAEVSLLRQDDPERTVLHLIHAVPQRRGTAIDIVEDVLPLIDVRIGVRASRPVATATLAPDGPLLPHETRDGVTRVTIPRVELHAVVAFNHA